MSKDNTKNLGEFAKTGGPGRPKGGRRKTLDVLDSMLAEAKNVEKFRDAIQLRFDKDLVDFFRVFVMPILPKDINIGGYGENGEILTKNINEVEDITKMNAEQRKKYIAYCESVGVTLGENT